MTITDDMVRELVGNVGTWCTDADTLGVEWKLDIETDHDTTISDFDCYGAVMWTPNDAWGRSQRPNPPFIPEASMPHARILDRDRSNCLWWWPLTEQWGDEARTHDYSIDYAVVRKVYETGFAGAILTRRTKCDCCGQPIDDTASLWGIDVGPFDNPDYWHETVRDLAGEIEAE